jgi:predicted O-methyltransferase YrrM
MIALPDNINSLVKKVAETSKDIDGCLTEREARFLALLAFFPTADGEILEIGSFKGKSTIVLAKGAQLSNKPRIISVDPLTSPSPTDPYLKNEGTCLQYFQANLKEAGVSDMVEFHHKYSYELAKEWSRKIRLLWIDGDHRYKGTKLDFDLFFRHLSDRAIIAFHDVIAPFSGPVRVFTEDVLLSDNFGPAGLWGTIGWAQRIADEKIALKFRQKKLKLHSQLAKLIPFSTFDAGKKMRRIKKLQYEFYRSRVPHKEISPSEWLKYLILKEVSEKIPRDL